MDDDKIIATTKKIARIVNQDFPFIFEDAARETLVKALIELHLEPKIYGRLFENYDDDLV